MNAQRKRALTASLLLILSSLAGCLGNDLEDEVVNEESLGTVLVSTYHVGELASAVGGDLVTVEMMSTMNVPLHDYEPSGQDLIRLSNADVFLYHGLDLEPWVDGAIADLSADGPVVASTHGMPTGETTLDYETMLISQLCTSLNSPGTTDVHLLAEHAEDADELHSDDAAHNMAFPEDDHDEDHHDEDDHDDHDEDGHDGHDEHDHGDREQLEAEETIGNPAGCPTDTVITVYHFEAGEYMLEFEADGMETFSMAIAAMGGAHHHHHGHGDEHGDEHGVCHDMSTHENHGEYETEEDCEAAGYLWMEDDHTDDGHGVCHDEDTHENHDEYETEEDCEAAGHHWMEGDHDDGPETPAEALEMFDTNNDSSISLEEFNAAMEDEEDDHDHGDHDDDHESHHNVALVYPDGTSALVDVEHDSLPENATGWNLTWAAMTENNISVNSTYGTNGNYISGIAGFDVPEDSSWWWELHTWNETGDAWETSTVGVDSVMIGDHTDHIAWAPNSTDDSTIPHPEDDHDDHDELEHELEMAMNSFLFSSADANSDGLLNMSDLETLFEMLEDTEDYVDTDTMVSIYIDVFDEDENDLISLDEFAEMMGAIGGDEDDHEEHDHEEHDHDSNETSNDDDDHDDMDEFMEMMFTMLDTNEDGSLNESELHAMMDMGEDEHEEGVAFIGFHVEEEGDYGIALPAGVTMHVLMRGGHDGHDHGDHDDHDDHGDEDGGDDHDDHGDEDGDDHDGHADEEIAFDPHSWLDPVAFAAQVEIVYDTLSAAFPEGAETFRANADAYKAELMAIDEGFTAAFGDGGTCTTNTVAANHNAYSYIAQRYDIDFVTLHGIDPEGEPSPDAIAEVLERVDEDGIKAIYVEEYSAEGALDSLIAQTVSDDLPNGLEILVLNTMEMAPTDSTEDYLSLMNENLENLKTGLGC